MTARHALDSLVADAMVVPVADKFVQGALNDGVPDPMKEVPAKRTRQWVTVSSGRDKQRDPEIKDED